MILGQHYNKLHEAGAVWPTAMNPKLIRVATLHWHDIETAPGVFNWTKADAIFSKIPAGVSVILACSGTPRFYSARPNEAGNSVFPTGTLAEPLDYMKYRNFIAVMKQRYPAITHVEGPNEPGPGSGYCSSAMPAILDWQRANWQETFTTGKPHTAISPPVILTDSGFATLAGIVGGTTGMHMIGVHYYSTTLNPDEFEATLFRVRQIIDANSGSRGKPIAITELGCNLPPYGVVRLRDLPPAVQAAFWESHLPVAAKYAAIVCPFACDDADHGWQGNATVEAVMNKQQLIYQ